MALGPQLFILTIWLVRSVLGIVKTHPEKWNYILSNFFFVVCIFFIKIWKGLVTIKVKAESTYVSMNLSSFWFFILAFSIYVYVNDSLNAFYFEEEKKF